MKTIYLEESFDSLVIKFECKSVKKTIMEQLESNFFFHNF